MGSPVGLLLLLGSIGRGEGRGREQEGEYSQRGRGEGRGREEEGEYSQRGNARQIALSFARFKRRFRTKNYIFILSLL